MQRCDPEVLERVYQYWCNADVVRGANAVAGDSAEPKVEVGAEV